MRILHIIPAAFNYFDDIKAEAFKLVENLHKLGIETDVFTLQYGGNPSSKSSMDSIRESAPSRQFVGMVGGEKITDEFVDYDIIHLHCPFFGAANKILKWKMSNPKIPFVVTYYRDIESTDLFAWIIKWYNSYYLPKIFAVADIVCQKNTLPNHLTRSVDKVKLIEEIVGVEEYAGLYSRLITK